MGIRIRPKEIEVPCKDPFRNDLLDRKESAKLLTRLINGIDGPCVLAIDAPWGAGKTTFLKMWSQDLRDKGFPVVEFNAWETDHAEDPFVALASELDEGLKAFGDDETKKKIKDTMEAAKKVVLGAIPGIIRIVTAGVLDVQPLIEKEAGNLLATYAENRLDIYMGGKESIKVFQDKLQAMANALAQSKEHPIMVFIDELDRCRPSYAVALIEVAKHLFEADHVVFVLAVNRTQLAHSIRALYGSEFDATGYLCRFFDIDFRLPEPDRSPFIQDLWKRLQIKHDHYLIEKLLGYSDLSIRQIGRAIHHLVPVVASLQKGSIMFFFVEVALIIRAIDSDSYWRFVQGDMTDIDLVDAIYKQVRIPDNTYLEIFEYIVVIAAKEIKSKNLGRVYDPQIESPLIDRYNGQGNGWNANEFMKFENEYQNIYGGHRGLFLDAVIRIEHFGR